MNGVSKCTVEWIYVKIWIRNILSNERSVDVTQFAPNIFKYFSYKNLIYYIAVKISLYLFQY